MNLTILLPEKTYWQGKVKKVVGEAKNGSFCLLPAHIDFVTIMVPGIFYTVTEEDQEIYIAINEGVLLKTGREVTLATRNAAKGDSLGSLKKQVEEDFKRINQQDRRANQALQKLEADFVRRFLDLEAYG
ncbi:MAG TPA: F0F1 ATP synthase subunit epsilon [Atribacterota bacterium]|nr:F0F1 ATP synthase subunit epsilon [Atribacterota bacterium]